MANDDGSSSQGERSVAEYPPGWDWDDEFECQSDEEYDLSQEVRCFEDSSAAAKVAIDEKSLDGLLDYLGSHSWSFCPELVRLRACNLLEHSLFCWGGQHPTKAERFALEAMDGLGSRAPHEYAGLHGMAALGARMGRGDPLGWELHVDWQESSDDDGMWSKHLQALVLGDAPPDWPGNLSAAARSSLQGLAHKMEWTNPGAMGAQDFAQACIGKVPEMSQYAMSAIDWRRLRSAWREAQCVSELEKAAGPGVSAPKRPSL